MKEIAISLILIVMIAVGAHFALSGLDWSAAKTYTTTKGSVRL